MTLGSFQLLIFTSSFLSLLLFLLLAFTHQREGEKDTGKGGDDRGTEIMWNRQIESPRSLKCLFEATSIADMAYAWKMGRGGSTGSLDVLMFSCFGSLLASISLKEHLLGWKFLKDGRPRSISRSGKEQGGEKKVVRKSPLFSSHTQWWSALKLIWSDHSAKNTWMLVPRSCVWCFEVNGVCWSSAWRSKPRKTI